MLDEDVTIYVSMDKSNKKVMKILAKVVSQYSETSNKVNKLTLNIDYAESTTFENSAAIHHSLNRRFGTPTKLLCR